MQHKMSIPENQSLTIFLIVLSNGKSKAEEFEETKCMARNGLSTLKANQTDAEQQAH